MEYKWNIKNLESRTADGYVTIAHWTLTATEIIKGTNFQTNPDKIYEASAYGTCSFNGELTSPYENLTKEQVLSWVWQSVNKSDTEQKLAIKINEKKNPVVKSGLPWSNT